MNIFTLDLDPKIAAREHCDKHVVKMICELQQLLSTAHRLLDGTYTEFKVRRSETDDRIKTLKHWALEGEIAEPVFSVSDEGKTKWKVHVYKKQCHLVSHAQHPAAIWCRMNTSNYDWLLQLTIELMAEYTHRYGKIHSTQGILKLLNTHPKNLPIGEFTVPPQTMPEQYKGPDVVEAYKNLYVHEKSQFAKWTNREVPTWFQQRVPNYNEADFARTR